MTARARSSRQASGQTAASVDPAEIARFGKLAAEWWNPDGPMKPLHRMNPTRLGFIRDQALAHFARPSGIGALKGLSAVDVGCGAGLLSEPMARMGASVTGLDPAHENIAAAKAHAEAAGLVIDYRADTIEALVADGVRFDIVLALEVVEHVKDPAAFIRTLADAATPGGLVILSTLNRSLRSYAAAIVGAEYLLRLLPVGTHDWQKFIRPEELETLLEDARLEVVATRGMVPDLMAGGFRLSSDTAVNYITAAVKPA
jgi:2-polyprenyl-6-hydroxyphenyl methylase/3-demethylubiquinone-9 3-methyltransferase